MWPPADPMLSQGASKVPKTSPGVPKCSHHAPQMRAFGNHSRMRGPGGRGRGSSKNYSLFCVQNSVLTSENRKQQNPPIGKWQGRAPKNDRELLRMSSSTSINNQNMKKNDCHISMSSKQKCVDLNTVQPEEFQS